MQTFTIYKSKRKNAYVIESNEFGVVDAGDLELHFSLYDEDELNNILKQYNVEPLNADDEGYEIFFSTRKQAQIFVDEFLVPRFTLNALYRHEIS